MRQHKLMIDKIGVPNTISMDHAMGEPNTAPHGIRRVIFSNPKNIFKGTNIPTFNL